MSHSIGTYGLLAEFTEPETLVSAIKQARAAGYRKMDAYSPFPVEGLTEALELKRSPVPLIVLVCGIMGGTGGYFMQWYATVISYPLNTGGRPMHSWPAYIPITFELTILCASLSAVFGMFALNRLPEPYHPVFNAPNFDRASQDRFFLCLEAGDAKFELQKTAEFLKQLQPVKIVEVPL